MSSHMAGSLVSAGWLSDYGKLLCSPGASFLPFGSLTLGNLPLDSGTECGGPA